MQRRIVCGTAVLTRHGQSGRSNCRLMRDKVASITKREITGLLEQVVEGREGREGCEGCRQHQLQARWQQRPTMQRATISSAVGGRRLGLSQYWHTTGGGLDCAPCSCGITKQGQCFRAFVRRSVITVSGPSRCEPGSRQCRSQIRDGDATPPMPSVQAASDRQCSRQTRCLRGPLGVTMVDGRLAGRLADSWTGRRRQKGMERSGACGGSGWSGGHAALAPGDASHVAR